MRQRHQAKQKLESSKSRTNPDKVKQEIRKDVSRGQGAMTSREAGAMRN
ncbi:hypothetical protein [Oceanobacillus alkalisoli]|nr:hypothetical protein [Oceanobacillus alkalisoli]MCF3942108.1 hypothetical protein [Oceanobacillus alkalisoli]